MPGSGSGGGNGGFASHGGGANGRSSSTWVPVQGPGPELLSSWPRPLEGRLSPRLASTRGGGRPPSAYASMAGESRFILPGATSGSGVPFAADLEGELGSTLARLAVVADSGGRAPTPPPPPPPAPASSLVAFAMAAAEAQERLDSAVPGDDVVDSIEELLHGGGGGGGGRGGGAGFKLDADESFAPLDMRPLDDALGSGGAGGGGGRRRSSVGAYGAAGAGGDPELDETLSAITGTPGLWRLDKHGYGVARAAATRPASAVSDASELPLGLHPSAQLIQAVEAHTKRGGGGGVKGGGGSGGGGLPPVPERRGGDGSSHAKDRGRRSDSGSDSERRSRRKLRETRSRHSSSSSDSDRKRGRRRHHSKSAGRRRRDGSSSLRRRRESSSDDSRSESDASRRRDGRRDRGGSSRNRTRGGGDRSSRGGRGTDYDETGSGRRRVEPVEQARAEAPHRPRAGSSGVGGAGGGVRFAPAGGPVAGSVGVARAAPIVLDDGVSSRPDRQVHGRGPAILGTASQWI